MFPLVVLVLGCQSGDPGKAKPGDSGSIAEPRQVPPPTFVNQRPDRLVAIGDVHGDLGAARKALQLAGVMDSDNQWIGGETWVLQTGDQLDRGDGEERILTLFEDLADQAHAAGGAFHSLLGNHEIMNVELDFRYATPGGFADFADTPYDASDPFYDDYPEEERGRAAAFRPGGEWATKLADHNVVMQVGDSVFVHAGVMPHHATYGLAKINNQTRRWMRGEEAMPSAMLNGDNGIVWTRLYSDDEAEPDCAVLTETLDALGAERMVVGHTVWEGINPACDGRVWRIDVGMSSYYGGIPMALTMEGDTLTPIQ